MEPRASGVFPFHDPCPAMLILSRRVGETTVIDDDVTVTVLGVNGGQVRLGIAAPAQVKVHREEVYHQIKAGVAPDGDADAPAVARTQPGTGPADWSAAAGDATLPKVVIKRRRT